MLWKPTTLLLAALIAFSPCASAGDFTMPGSRTHARVIRSSPSDDVLLETINFTNSAGPIPTTVPWTRFNTIEVLFENITQSVSAVIFINYHTNGAYQSSNYTAGFNYTNLGASPSTVGAFATGSIPIVPSGFFGYTTSGYLKIYNINFQSQSKSSEGRLVMCKNGVNCYYVNTGGFWSGPTPVDGLEVLVASGTISGILKIYGVR